jgi:long-chain acyl-CoA synthetase
LAANGIPSFTLSSLSLLSEVLESHPPSAIITQGSFMPQLLELIYDSAAHEHHTVIVLGDATSASHLENVNILSWEDIERQGANLPALNSSRPGRLCFPRKTYCIIDRAA